MEWAQGGKISAVTVLPIYRLSPFKGMIRSALVMEGNIDGPLRETGKNWGRNVKTPKIHFLLQVRCR